MRFNSTKSTMCRERSPFDFSSIQFFREQHNFWKYGSDLPNFQYTFQKQLLLEIDFDVRSGWRVFLGFGVKL